MPAAYCALTGRSNHNPRTQERAKRSYAVETKHGFLSRQPGSAVLNFFDRVLASQHSLFFYGFLSLSSNFTDA